MHGNMRTKLASCCDQSNPGSLWKEKEISNQGAGWRERERVIEEEAERVVLVM